MAAVAHPTRPSQIRRAGSPLSFAHGGRRAGGGAADTGAGAMNRINMSDSDSDDEPPPAIRFSKVTQALLADAPVPSSSPKQEFAGNAPRFERSISTGRANVDTPSRAPGLRIVRKNSPVSGSDGRGTTPSRVVHVSSSGSAAKRSISVSGPHPSRPGMRREPTPTRDSHHDIVTPAPALRQVRVVTRSRANSNASQDGRPTGLASSSRPGSRAEPQSGAESDQERDHGADFNRSTSHPGQDMANRLGSSTIGKPRNASADAPPPGSQRIKRAPLTGAFLKSGPVRRGFRRRESDDNVSPADEDAPVAPPSHGSSANFTPRDRSASRLDRPGSRSGVAISRAGSVEPVSVHDFAQRQASANRESRPSSRQGTFASSRGPASGDVRPSSRSVPQEVSQSYVPSVDRPTHSRQTSIPPEDIPASIDQPRRRRSTNQAQPQAHPQQEQKAHQRQPSLRTGQYRYVGPKVQTDALSDQENIPPPTFKRNKDQEFKYLGKPAVVDENNNIEKPKSRQQVEETPVPVPAQQQQQRKVLGALSGNTPYRAAPAPPPKMSVLDAATATAGASVAKSKKKRSHIVVNGKIFTQMGKIGKGGSSDVYCVMAENYKTFALKRVKLDDCDESAVRGFKGEIDLLKKLTEVERVVRLFDWELNEEKQELCVLMEKGDTDLNRLLTLRLNAENASFDPIFTRYHWREMLECVQAVHDQDIVHSDLKPANFLLVQGRLKLIDFGIANAIDTDNTCNVHRDTHVGTPNYMSPESITDTNASSSSSANHVDSAGRPLKKDMRIGKASDIWSLGCILYQMTYGRPPFAHIPNQISRIMAITNPHHTIDFPLRGVGDAEIPPSLRNVLRKCLNRDPEKRPSCAMLLDGRDGYLFPEAEGKVLVGEELLGLVIAKVVERCRDEGRGLPTNEEVRQYPRSFMEKIREMVEKG